MAISIVDVQSKSANAATAVLTAFAANPSNGDTIVVGYVTFASGTHLAPTDNYGNTYTQIGAQFNPVGQPPYMSLWYAKNIVGGAGFVVTARPNVTYYAVVAWALTGVAVNPYNGDFASATRSGVAAAMSVGPTTPAPAANSIFLAFGCPQQAAPVPGDSAGWNTTGVNGFTAAMLARARVADYAANENNYSTYKISSTVETPAWTTAYTLWGAMTASFAPIGAPTVTGISPGQGSTLGGTPVVITGTNFTSDATVDFGGTPATGVVFVNSTTINAVSPAHAAGLVVVTVTEASGSASLAAAAWEYKVQPTLTNAVPQFGTSAGGTPMTLTGANFVAGATVLFGATPATAVVFVDSTRITCTTPAHAAGATIITVTNP